MAVPNNLTWIFLFGVVVVTVIQLTHCQNVPKSNLNKNSSETNDYKLIFAHIIYRHGDRNPMESYPNDPYKDESFWKNGFGALTNVLRR